MNRSPGEKPLRSPSPRHRVLFAAVIAMLAIGCYFAGWHASRYAHASRSDVVLPQPPFTLPVGHRVITLPPEWIDGTASEGQRIDLIALHRQTQPPIETPLILDALVLRTHPSLTLLVSPRDHHILNLWTSQPERPKLRPSPTVVVAASESAAAPGSRSTVN